jgi:hypothetical protein
MRNMFPKRMHISGLLPPWNSVRLFAQQRTHSVVAALLPTLAHGETLITQHLSALSAPKHGTEPIANVAAQSCKLSVRIQR